MNLIKITKLSHIIVLFINSSFQHKKTGMTRITNYKYIHSKKQNKKRINKLDNA